MRTAPTGDKGDSGPPSPSGLLLRPVGFLLNLPVAYRWEFTRRHPYYLSAWEAAHRYHAKLLADPTELAFGKLAITQLQAIGFSGDPPPPTADAEALSIKQLGSVWEGGAIAPQSFRALATLMILELPPEARVRIAMLLAESAGWAPDVPYDVIFKLLDAPEPELDLTPNRPIIGINIEASQRAILEAVGELVGQWKGELNVPERRRPSDARLDEYLKAWDLYEGWTGGGYDVRKEPSFKEVGAATSAAPQTVADRYASAFRLISGHAYSFETWVRLFAVEKLAGLHGARSIRRRRVGGPRRKSGGVGAVTETTLTTGRGRGGGGLLDGQSSYPSPQDVTDALIEVRGYLEQRFTDEAIVRRMKFDDPKAGRALVRSIRQHLQYHAKP